MRRPRLLLALLTAPPRSPAGWWPCPRPRPPSRPVTWSDEFNAPVPHVDRRVEVEVRHRRQRVGQQRAAVLHELDLQRLPRRHGQPRDHRATGEPVQLPVPLRHLSVHLGPHPDRGQVHPGSTATSRPGSRSRGARASGRRSGCWAAAPGPTAARSTSWRTSASEPEHRLRHHPRPRLLRRQRGRRHTARSGSRWPTPSTLTAIDWSPNLDHPGTLDGSEYFHAPRPACAATPGSSTTRSS